MEAKGRVTRRSHPVRRERKGAKAGRKLVCGRWGGSGWSVLGTQRHRGGWKGSAMEKHERELGTGPWGSGSRNKGVRSRSQCHEKPGVSGEGVREGVAWSD